MKNTIIIFISLFTLHTFTIAQGCLPEGITFTTQQQIDDFQTNYPGCTEIEGDVNIGEWEVGSDIFDLIGLNLLISIGGDISFKDNYYLSNLTGLDNLTSVG